MNIRIPIEEGGVLAFNRALGYADDERRVPPTYLQAANHFDPEFGARPRAGQPWRGSNDAVKASSTATPPAMYAEQHYEYFAELTIGDVLIATDGPSRSWEKTGRRGGQLTFTETVREFRREATGELVALSRKVVVQPSRVSERRGSADD